jgi:P27 family predicted phage terminase small subunit
VAKPGRKPKPTVLKKLEGDIHKERWPKHEPQPPDGKTTMPSFLNQHARNEWQRLAPRLYRLGLLNPNYRSAFADYCQSWGMLVDVENKLKELNRKSIDAGGDASNAYLLKTQAGNVIISPLLSIRHRLQEQVSQLGAKFGLSPADQSGINIAPEAKETDPMEALLNATDYPERER